MALISLSDGWSKDKESQMIELISTLNNMGFYVELSKTLYRRDGVFSGTPLERASELNKLFKDKEIKAIFDISGGDSANQILSLIDYECIRKNPKPFLGLSDLTTILNALYHKSEIKTFHYKIRNLIGNDKEIQQNKFINSFFKGKVDIFDFPYTWLRGNRIKGEVIGGNLRCFLKLSGTEYLPDPVDKVLLLEGLGGDFSRITSLICQLNQIGYLDKISGLVLGTFTELINNNDMNKLCDFILDLTKDKELPIIKTERIGHGDDAVCIIIGETLILEKK